MKKTKKTDVFRISKISSKLNKKGQVADFTEFIIASLIIIVLAAIIIIIISAITDDKENEYKKSELFIETTYTTRTILQTPLDSGKKLYQEITLLVNQDEYEKSFNFVEEAISKHFTKPDEKWLIIINDKSRRVNTNTYPYSVESALPRTEIPNPYGDNIKVAFRKIKQSDYDLKIPKFYDWNPGRESGSRTDSEGLKEIKGIPNIICDERNTEFGKICKANEELVEKLEDMSEKKLQKEGWKLIVTQAYRTWEIQNYFWEKYNHNSKMACNPGPINSPNMGCTHMTGGAIDVSLYDAQGNKMSASTLEALMCEYGLRRYANEAWHFEYGTERAQRAEDENVCAII